MASRPFTGLALCAGAGGLELGVGLACDALGIGGGYRLVGAVERDAYAAACLVARMEDETLDQAPVWDDLATFDGRPWRGRVDLVSAGFPCQPWSQVGKRAGRDDARWLWPLIVSIIRDVGPGLVFVENVPGLAARGGGLGDVLGSLADLGFDAEWERLGAAEVGAPHKRERFWLLAYRDRDRCARFGREPGHDGHARDDADRPGSTPMADTRGVRCGVLGDTGAVRDACSTADGDPQERERGGDAARDRGPSVADASGARREGTEGPSGRVPRPRDDRTGLADPDREARNVRTGNPPRIAGFPPRPDDTDGWADWIAEGGPEPSVRRDADGLASRLDRLHTIGNGVVPLVAAAAFVRLARRAGLVIGDSCEA